MVKERLEQVLREQGLGAAGLSALCDGSGPDTVWVTTVPLEEAVGIWHRLRTVMDSTGCWPVILGGEHDLANYEEFFTDSDDASPAEIIAQGEALDVPAFLAERTREAVQWSGGALPGLDWPADFKGEPGTAEDNFALAVDALPGDVPSVFLGFVPTTVPWHVPAYLRFGGWNDCPDTPGQVAMMKRWHEQYGAEPVVMTGDILEARVTRPPHNREAALALAREHYAFCTDIVDQGTESIGLLAAGLLNGKVWFFWWD